MRRILAFSWVCFAGSVASAQFAADRTSTPPGPAPITATPPVSPSPAPSTAPATPTPPSFQQVSATTPPAASPTLPPTINQHPWYVKPEHGQWMLCVKSYGTKETGDSAKLFAETLAKEIRETYKTPAYLFEYGAEEKRKEDERAKIQAEQQRKEREREFLTLTEKLRAESMSKGYEFVESPPTLRVRKINYDVQYAVLIGGWKDMETARKALDTVRTWQPPQNKQLMDRGFVGEAAAKGQNATLNGGYLNPFKLAMVVPNPTAPKTLGAEAGADPLVLQMNNEEPMTVLKIKKPWTIVVKSFHAPLVDVRDKDAGSVMSVRKLFNSRPEHLNKTAELGVNLAKMLRSIKPDSRIPSSAKAEPFESYVLHTLNGTLVCVGQFDSLEDPQLAEAQRRLEAVRFHIENREIYPFDKLVGMRVK
jgi:hypothetical protein